MKATGIIVEYNPFHNGHYYHASKARQLSGADVVVAVMSSSFLQRGTPALLPKWERAEMALHHGVDLVVELPYAYACQHADLFSKGALSILASLNVASLCFGSESGEIDAFFQSATIMLQEEQKKNKTLAQYLKQGMNYPTAYAKSFESFKLPLDLSKPNNILGLQYVKSILTYHYPIKPFTIQRTTDYHSETIEQSIASATSIRHHLLAKKPLKMIKQTLPEASYNIIQKYETLSPFISWEQLFPYLKYRVKTSSIPQLATILEAEEGLEYRIQSLIHAFPDFSSFIEAFKTKRYTQNRLQRFCTHILTNTTKEEITTLPAETPYVRLLGMNEKGRQYLNYIKKDMPVPLVTKRANHHHSLLDIEERAHLAHSMGYPASQQKRMMEMEYKRPPVLLKKK